jgi:formylglycine-generating enzyme required for sulfatase activity
MSPRLLRAGALLIAALFVACGPAAPVGPAGTPDAGVPDAGVPDAGVPDAGVPDAGVPDAGSPDAGTPDAGTPDAGSPDAGPCAGLDLATDPANCGTCGNVCSFADAGATCQGGQCVMGACNPGFVDVDQDAGDGCEYACTPTSSSTEICDGLDNDCNGAVDDNPTDPDLGTACGAPCPGGDLTNCIGTCQAGAVTCTGGAKVCSGGQGPTAEVCDGLDNDCNGYVDDPFTGSSPGGYLNGDPSKPLYNSDPSNCGGCGPSFTCQLSHAENGCHSASFNSQGNCYVAACDVGFRYVGRTDSDPSHPTCNVLTAGSRDSVAGNPRTGVGCFYSCPQTPSAPETCDGVDNDCDGCIDNGLHPPTVQVSVPFDPATSQAAHTVWIGQFESSRLDGTGSAEGTRSERACVTSSRLPWTHVNYAQATAACQAAGGRLCTEAEWQLSCEAAQPPDAGASAWSQSSSPQTYLPGVCNDANASTSGPWQTGTSDGGVDCFADLGGAGRIYDLSGNVAEWTATPHDVGLSGTNATLGASGTSGVAILTVPSDLSGVQVGDLVQITGSATPAHNGLFTVRQLLSSTSVQLSIPGYPATATAESGLQWTDEHYVLRGGEADSASAQTTCEEATVVEPASFTGSLAGFRCCFDAAP